MGVIGNYQSQRFLVPADLLRFQPVFAQLTRQQVTFSELEFLALGVARQIDQLHPIEQRSRNSANVVRGRDEDDLRKIERYVEVAIDKSVVLARIEHLEQGACRVATKVGADLIDLIEHHDRIARAGTTQLLNDASRHRPDVGAAVAPNLRFIANTAEAHPYKPPAQSIRDRLTQTGLSDSRRTEQT